MTEQEICHQGTPVPQAEPSVQQQYLAWRLAVRMELFARYVGKAVQGKSGKKVVHNLRVSCRKLRALLRNFKAALPVKEYQAVIFQLKLLTEKLGFIRELDVLQQEITRTFEVQYTERARLGFTVLNETLTTVIRGKRDIVIDAAGAFLNTPGYLYLAEYVSEYHDLNQLSSVCQNPQMKDFSQRTIEALLRKIADYAIAMEAEVPEEDFHKLRIIIKNLQYTLDDFGCLYDHGFEIQKARTQNLLSLMGRIHDRQVWAAQIIELLAVVAEKDGESSAAYQHSSFAVQILTRKWQYENTAVFNDLKDIWRYLDRSRFWLTFFDGAGQTESEQGGQPIASESEDQHLEDLTDRTPE